MDIEKLGKIIINVTAIVALTVICLAALRLGIDTSIVAGTTFIIGGIAGYKIAVKRK